MGKTRVTGPGLLILMLTGCVLPIEPDPNAPLAEPRDPIPAAPQTGRRAPTYAVVAGDTLDSIASRFRVDPRDLARWNHLNPPYDLKAGQALRLNEDVIAHSALSQPTASGGSPPPAHKNGANGTGSSRSSRQKPTNLALGDKVVAGAQKDSLTRSGIAWRWPAVGRFAKPDDSAGKKGLEILGAPGQAVNAAADGLVVYSGNGLGDYGQLIIVKHNNVYLSAYAHNSKLVASEGVRVKAGQKIAEMGGPNGQDIKLYFEIRRNGKPVNPLSYLPQQ